jgi:hypothetical protein
MFVWVELEKLFARLKRWFWPSSNLQAKHWGKGEFCRCYEKS